MDGHWDFCSGCSDLRPKLWLSKIFHLSHAAWVMTNSKAFKHSKNIGLFWIQNLGMKHSECIWIWLTSQAIWWFYMAAYLGCRWLEVIRWCFTFFIIAFYLLLCSMASGKLFDDLWPLSLQGPSEVGSAWENSSKSSVWNPVGGILTPWCWVKV